MRTSRIFYVGMVCTDAYVKAIQQDAFVGAGSGKMSAVVSALRHAKRRTVLVSLPFVTTGPKRQPAKLCWRDGFPALFLPVRRSRVERKVLGAFSFAWFAMRLVRQHDTILFYNHAPEYLLALFILRLRRIAVFQDIEDLPINSDHGLRGFLNRLGYELMFKLASARKVTVSNQIGKELNLRNFLAVQGVAAKVETEGMAEKWAQLEAGLPLRVHYGGTLMASTGLDLFCATVTHLDSIAEPTNRRIEFIVTGIGDLDLIRDLSLKLCSNTLHVEVHQEISRDAYFELLNSCHASLSLRNPNSEYSSTTFPSKVIEITSRGLSLVATRVSDVGEIFSDNNAWLLSEFSDEALSAILDYMIRNPAEVRRKAEEGQVIAKTRFASEAVGRGLAEFLEVEPKST